MTDYSRIFASAPINVTAAKVISRSGVQWKPEKQLTRECDVRSHAPLPTRPFRGPCDQDLTGKTFGRLAVTGQAHGIKTGKNGAGWVVRCTCGYFEIRRTQSLKKLDPRRAMCTHCDYLEEVKRGNTIPNRLRVEAA